MHTYCTSHTCMHAYIHSYILIISSYFVIFTLDSGNLDKKYIKLGRLWLCNVIFLIIRDSQTPPKPI